MTKLNCFWEILHEEKLFQGRPFEVGNKQRIMLRHFNSGRLLCTDERNNLVLEKVSTDMNVYRPDPLLLSIDPIQKGHNRLFSNQSYNIYCHSEQNIVLSHSQEYLSMSDFLSNVKTIELKKEMLFTPLEDSYFDEKRIVRHILQRNLF